MSILSRLLQRGALAAAILYVVAPGTPAMAQAPDRASDEQVKKTFEDIKTNVDRFADGVDSKIRSAVISSPTGPLDVGGFLKDYKDATDKMKDRFKSEYGAETEVLAFLKQSKTVDASVRPEWKSADEWAALRVTAVRLAKMYRIDFEALPSNWVAKRPTDKQAEASVEKLAKDAEAFTKSYKKGLEADKALDPAKRKQAEAAADALQKAADSLKSEFNGSNVPAPQLEALMNNAHAFSSAPVVPVSGAAQGAWKTFHGHLTEVADTFGMPAPK